jgi:hypothetical protein
MRLLSSRKGQDDEDTISWLPAVVLGCLLLLFGAWLAYNIYANTKDNPAETACRASIQTHAKLLDLSADTIKTELKCEPRTITVKVGDEENAKRQLAEAMRSCWDRWGKGNLVLFKESGIYCNPCAYITFDKPSGITGFEEYLQTAFVPKTQTTYADYLLGTSSSQGSAVKKKPGSSEVMIPFSTDRDAVVFFVYAKGTSVQKMSEYFSRDIARNTKEIASNTVVGAAAGVGIALFVIGTGGVGAIVIGGIGAASGGVLTYLYGDAKKPEWISLVMLRQNDAAELKKIGCEFAQQQGVSEGDVRDV